MTSSTGRLDVLEAEGAGRGTWEELIEQWPDQEVFAHPAYLDLYRTPGQRPLCLVYRSTAGTVIHPVMAGEISSSPTSLDLAAPPFGYGGPFVDGGPAADRAALLGGFYDEFARWAQGAGVVAEYALFSPVLGAPARYPGRIMTRMPVVVRNLELSEEDLWADYKKSLRTQIRSAWSQGVSVTVDLEGHHSAEHLAIHHATMDHRDGTASHRLTHQFVTAMKSTLAGRFVYVHAWLDGEVISSDLCLVSARTVLAFRGGTHPDRYATKAGPLVTHACFLWAKQTGRSAFILGGGSSGEDSIFAHKLKYARQGVRQLQAGHWVLDPERYAALLEQRRLSEAEAGFSWVPSDDFFPAYRAPTTHEAPALP